VLLAVRPSLIPLSTVMASVKGAYNAVWVHGKYGEDTFYYGRGAGSRPTGVAVVSDLMRVAREIRCGSPERVSPFAHERLGEYKPIPITLNRSGYYLRFRVEDRPGIIAKLAAALADQQISIDSVLQLPIENWRDLPFVITVEPTSEESVRAAIREIKAMNFLLEPPLVMPMENSL
jgi:homoserine dehydrogenase